MAGDKADVQYEIDLLKKSYDCKIIENIDSFKFIVTVHLENKKASIKFQLTDQYPNEQPETVVKGLNFQDQDVEKYKAENPNFSMTEFTEFVGDCLKENKATVVGANVSSTKGSKKKSRGKSKGSEAVEIEEEKKKASMKTATDVIKRIKWDPELNAADFTVGYLDRFLGILEDNFTIFNWDDLASVDHTDVAIPKHRIQYFKYREVVVWDKTKRLDDVFGSTGSSLTIRDIVENYDEFKGPSGGGDETGPDTGPDIETIITTSGKREGTRHDRRPNHFVCLRVTDESVLSKMKEVQDEMSAVDGKFEEFMVPRERIHMTLCTLDLQGKEDLDLICSILEENRDELVYLSRGISLELKKLDQFFNRVVYCKVVESDDRLQTFVEHLKLVILEKGLRIADAYDFVPHVTLMKASPDEPHRTIPRRVYALHEEVDFGRLGVDELILCEISKVRSDDGFYKHHYRMSLE